MNNKDEENRNGQNKKKKSFKSILRGDVPLYRSYGQTENLVFQRLLEIFYQILATVFLFCFLSIALVALVMAFLYAPLLIKICMGVILLILLLYRPLRVCQKRLGFTTKLKRFCKRNGYTLTFNRRFPKNLFHSSEVEDFSVDTGKRLYYCSFITVVNKHTELTFVSKERLRFTTRLGKNKIYTIYDVKPKVREKEFIFPYVPNNKWRKTMRAVILNPSPQSVYVMNKDGGRVLSGTGDTVFGVCILTGSSFINTVDRESRDIEQ